MTTTTTRENDGRTDAVQTQNARPRRRPRAFARTHDDGLTLTFELPGATRDTIELGVEAGELHLVAGTSLADPEGSYTRAHLEFAATDFEGRWALPDDVDLDAATSELKHGVLTLRLPFRAKERRTIEVS